MNAPDRDSRPALRAGIRLQHDRVRDQWVLLAPERVIELDETARQVVQRFDGEHSLAQIAQALAQEFDAPVAEIEADVIELAATLGHKRVLRA